MMTMNHWNYTRDELLRMADVEPWNENIARALAIEATASAARKYDRTMAVWEYDSMRKVPLPD